VNSTVDAPDAHPGDGLCADKAGQCTLRAALQEAARAGTSVMVTVPAGSYLLKLGTLRVRATKPHGITVTGAGPMRTIVSAGNAFRVMTVAAATTLTLHDLQLTGGNAGAHLPGGGLVNKGTLTLSGTAVDLNRAGGGGAGIDNTGGRLVIRATHIDGNTTGGGGGGILSTGRLTVFQSSFDHDQAGRDGGAIDASGTVTVTRSTLANNGAGGTSQGYGAAIWLNPEAVLQLVNSTVANNTTSPSAGDAIDNADGKATLSFDTLMGASGDIKGSFAVTGTVLAGAGTAPVCAATVTEPYGYNLSSDLSCNLSAPTDEPGANPQLGSLASNGGPTQTMAVTSDSPVVDAGGLPTTSKCPATDQRGQSRPFGPACDIGAYELKY
jgi:CSLREA domain-containing protein